MSNCSSCPSKGTCGKSEDTCGIQNNARNKIKHVIGVMSGKAVSYTHLDVYKRQTLWCYHRNDGIKRRHFFII